MKKMIISSVLVLSLFILLLNCESCRNTRGIQRPEYYAFNMPMKDIPLPAFFVGPYKQLSGGCFKQIRTIVSTDTYASIVETAVKKREYETELKASFQKAFIKAGLGATLSGALMDALETKIENVSVYAVDPVYVVPDLTNSTCKIKEFKWFDDKRTVLTGGLKAKKLTVSLKSALSKETRDLIEATIPKVNVDLKLKFYLTASSDNELKLEADDVFFGGFTTVLVAETDDYKETVSLHRGEGKTVPLGGKYKLFIQRSQAADRFTVSVAIPLEGISTGKYDIELDSAETYALGPNRVVRLYVYQKGSNYAVESSILLVGASGKGQ